MSLDLDTIRDQLAYASNGIDGPDTLYNPHALQAMRAAEKLLVEVERLQAENAQLRADLNRAERGAPA